jgi:hypothetical protein
MNSSCTLRWGAACRAASQGLSPARQVAPGAPLNRRSAGDENAILQIADSDHTAMGMAVFSINNGLNPSFSAD